MVAGFFVFTLSKSIKYSQNQVGNPVHENFCGFWCTEFD